MAITSSAKKANRASLRKRVFNMRRAEAVRKLFKDIKKLVLAGKQAEGKSLLSKAYKAIDKASKMHTFHKNTASRKKSQIARLLESVK